jgi:Concanavalin A-like lectin/glucanases superfamily/Right handed beta helix region
VFVMSPKTKRPRWLLHVSTRHFRLALLASACALLALPVAAQANVLHATPANLSSVFGSAQAGDTVLLASGSYGTFQGGMKPGMVTLAPEPGATPSMQVNFVPAANITLDGIAITDLLIANSASHDLTVRNSSFDQAQAEIRTGDLSNAKILFDHNTHVGFVKCGNCGEGRVFLPGKTSQPSGVTIQNSYFAGGNSDGIQNGGRGVQILNNEFTGIHQIDGANGVHADAIQLYGSSGTVVRGNYMHDVADGIMAPDGTDHEIVQDNVMLTDGYPFAITMESDNGSIVQHNTLPDGKCDYNLHCGILRLGSKSGQPGGTGTVIKDNILSEIAVPEGSQSNAEENYNLFTSGSGKGAQDQRGAPRYVGGSGLASYILAAGSLGKGTASDGADRGARLTPSPAPAAPAGPKAQPSGSATGLVLAFGFDERKGRTVADASGKGNTGRLRGVGHTKIAHSGRALKFQGHGTVSVADSASLDLTTGMTLEAWVRPTAGGGWRTVLAKRRGSGASYALYGNDGSGRPIASGGKGRGRTARGGRRLRLRHWTHLAVTYDGSKLRLYVNGVLSSRRAGVSPLRAGSGRLLIGGGAPGGRYFKGEIDDVRVYSRALSRNEIGKDMRTPV